jgi:gliding motility-associated-like protein
LSITASPNYETKSSYTVRIKSTDQGGLSFEKAFTITVTNVNEAPTALALSTSSVAENASSGTTLGALSSTDVDAGNTFTYTLVSGSGSTDNASFAIVGAELRTAGVFDFESKSSYAVRVRTTDAGGLSFDRELTISVTNVNEAPSDIALTANSVAENVAANSTIGSLSTTDVDAGNTFTYTLVAGAGDTDNAAFNISGSSLRITASPNFETKSSYTVRIKTADQGGLSFEKAVTITITNVNEAPSDIALTANSVAENVAANSTIGTLSTTDVDADNTFTYTLVAGTGDTDNAAFNINSNSLRITASPDFETKNSYTVRIKTADQGGLSFEKAVTITITNVNEAPSDIALTANSIAENVAANSTIGTLSTTDSDAGNTFTYTLVAGAGSTDNAAFNINSNSLRITASPDFETKSSYSLRVRSTDQDGLFLDKVFVVSVSDVVENVAPTNITVSINTIDENNAVNAVIGTFSSSDEDAGDSHRYTLVTGTGDTDNASFNVVNNQLRAAISFDFETKKSFALRIRATDAGGLSFEKEFTITVTDLNEDRDGDGAKDDQERAEGTNLLDACSFKLSSQNTEPSDAWKAGDCDGDGLSNQKEKGFGTNPFKADTDGDGESDGVEVTAGTDPKTKQGKESLTFEEGGQEVKTFSAVESGVWSLEKEGPLDQASLFELILNVDKSVTVRFKSPSTPDTYQVNVCATDPSGVRTCTILTIKVTPKPIILNVVIATGEEQELVKDSITNIATIEKAILGDIQEVANFTTNNVLIWTLEGFGPRDDSDFFDLVFETQKQAGPVGGRILYQLRTSDSFVTRVTVVFKQDMKAGIYQVKLSAKDLYGNSTFILLKVTVLANVMAVIPVENPIVIPWGSSQVFETEQQVITSDRERPFLGVKLDDAKLNRFARGDYRLSGEFALPDYIKNPFKLKADKVVRVLPKAAPLDVTLTEKVFAADIEKLFVYVGGFDVVDTVDTIHEVKLYTEGYDNKFFEIKDKNLFWNSADPAAGRTSFTILVRVIDRDGNTLDKSFEITRTRQSLSSLEVYNTFSPNGDGFNEVWGVPGVKFFTGARIQVFDRGGLRIFYTEDPSVKWDGNKDGIPLPVGTYYWVVQVDETNETRRGIVNLLSK